MVFILLVAFFRRLLFPNCVTSGFYDLHKKPNFHRIANTSRKEIGNRNCSHKFPHASRSKLGQYQHILNF